jgi:amino acid transporter
MATDVALKRSDEEPAREGHLVRSFTLWSSFSFSLAFISPCVALYGVFALSITTAGPAFWLGFPLIFVAQLVIAIALGELVSRWPLEGSIYQWSRRLIGAGGGWVGGWVYIWTLMVSMASVATGAAGFLARSLGINPTPGQIALITIAFLLLGTVVNLAGSVALRVVITASIIAETVGTVGLGLLLLFHRHQHLSAITHGLSGHVNGSYFTGPFLIAISILGYSFVGFESAGSMAEEVKNPRRTLPRALVFSMAFVAVIVSFAGLMLILATPNLGAVLGGTVSDPVYGTLSSDLGTTTAKLFEVLFTIAFLASFLAVQTTSSRMIWAYARDRALPMSRPLARLNRQNQPVTALCVATSVGIVIVILGRQTPHLYQLLVNFSAAGFFVAYLFPLSGSLISRLRGRWQPGEFNVGRYSLAVTAAAIVFAAAEFVNIAWPRRFYPQWYLNWAVWIAVAVLAVTGAILYLLQRDQMDVTPLDDASDDDLTAALISESGPATA